jgi:HAD superfamily hydrolase (TIGR01549 family)
MMIHQLAPTIAGRSHWVFDLDGTLTVPVHDFACIRRELDVPEGADILGHLMSLPAHRALPLHNRLNEIERELAGLTLAAEGALQLLQHLQECRAELGILTRNTRENALRTLELIGLDSYFNPAHILGRDDALPKPDPDGKYRLAEIWGIKAESAVMVGDYQYDLQAGRSAGALTVHVDVTRGFRWPELADLSVGTLGELHAWFNP